MISNKIRNVVGYLAIPAVSAGILGGAALGLAGGAAADTEGAQPNGTLASVTGPTGDLVSVSEGRKATKASECCKAAVSGPTGDLASVTGPTGDLVSVSEGRKATKASVKPKAGGNLASVSEGRKATKA